MYDSLLLTVTLLLALHAHGASAADDIDENIAIVVFAILIAIFSGIAILFAFLILRIKHQDWRAARSSSYDISPGHLDLEKNKSNILRINSDHGITGYHSRPGSDVVAYNGKTPSDFSAAIYVNPGFSSEIDEVLDTTSTFKQQPEEEKTEVEPQPQDSTAPNFGGTENISSDATTIVVNENFVDEDSPVTETLPETDNLPAMDKNSDTKSAASTDEISAPTDNDSDNGNERSSSSSDVFVPNNVTGDDVAPLSAVGSHLDPVVSHPASKKKSQGALFKRYGSQDSQKPLLFSQSSTTSSLSSVTVDGNGVGRQVSSSPLPDAFNESDEQKNDESKL